MRILDIVTDTIVDGPGFRTSIYMAGCAHRCAGCHNTASWDFRGGREMSADELYDIIMSNEGGVTFTGGDPVYQATSLVPLMHRLKNAGKDIWVYTGFTFEELLDGLESRLMLRFADVVVDGMYDEGKRDDTLVFRGSSNQRIIDVKRSIDEGRVVEMDLDYLPSF